MGTFPNVKSAAGRRSVAFFLALLASGSLLALDGDERVYTSPGQEIVIDRSVFRKDGTVDFEKLEQKYTITAEDDLYLKLSKVMEFRIQEQGMAPDEAYSMYLKEIELAKSRLTDEQKSQFAGNPKRYEELEQRIQANRMSSTEREFLAQAIAEVEKAKRDIMNPNSIAMKQAEATLSLDAFAGSGLIDEKGRATEYGAGQVPIPDDIAEYRKKMENIELSTYGYEMVIFISQSMPKREIMEALELAREVKAVVAIRGVKEGQMIDDVSRWFYQNVSDDLRANMPPLTLNPIVFKDAGVDLVPAIGFRIKKADPTERQSKDVWLVSQGTLSPDYVLRFLDVGEAPKVVGPTYEIAEIDMIEHFRLKMEAYDWEGDKKRAVTRFWKRMPKFDLETSLEDSEREFDPTVVVQQDVPGAYGETILAKGTKINPLDSLPMTKTMVVFNAMKNYEIDRVREYVQTEIRRGKTPESFIFMTTDMNREEGKVWWGKYFGTLYEMTGKPVPAYYFQQNLMTRFGIRQTPTIIYAKDRKVIIKTLGVDSEEIRKDELTKAKTTETTQAQKGVVQ